MNRKQLFIISPEAAPYLKTLRRIPADVRLSMATRAIDPDARQTCICGWAIREAIAAVRHGDATYTDRDSDPNVSPSSAAAMRDLYGGTYDEWDRLYWDVASHLPTSPLIEEAFVTAIQEAAEGRELVSI